MKLVEHPRLVGRGNADACVRNADAELVGSDGRAEGDHSLDGELHGVVEQVLHDLLQAIVIATNHRQIARHFLSKAQPGLLDDGPERAPTVFQQS